nr:calcium-binding protein [Neisseria perflava]
MTNTGWSFYSDIACVYHYSGSFIMSYCYGGFSQISFANAYCAPISFNSYKLAFSEASCAPSYSYSADSSDCSYTPPAKPAYQCIVVSQGDDCEPIVIVKPFKPAPATSEETVVDDCATDDTSTDTSTATDTSSSESEVCTTCVDDDNQDNSFGGVDTEPGNIIYVDAVDSGATTTTGTDEKDTIYGTSGEDIIYGGSGADVIYGGDGNDTLEGDDNGDTLYGGAGKDYLQGGAGNDYLNGGTGADIMRGGDGNDVFYVDDAGDEVYEDSNAASGIDTVRSEIDYTLPDNVENLILQGTDDLNGTGNELDNIIYGNGGNNELYGLVGDDCIVAKDGNDTLVGGTGNDILIGGDGDDTYVFNSGDGNDIISDVSGDDVLSFGDGITASDIILTQDGDNLVISFCDSEDSITVSDWFTSSDNQIETFSFADGSTYEVSYGSDTSCSLSCLTQIDDAAQAAQAAAC